MDEPKTKKFVSLVASHTPEKKVLVVGTSFDENTYRAAGNVQPVLLMTADEVNVEHLLGFEKILVTQDALAKLAERTAKA